MDEQEKIGSYDVPYVFPESADEMDFRKMVESIQDVIYEVGLDGKINYVSPAVEKLLGYVPEDFYGKNFFSFVYESDVPLVKEALQYIDKPRNSHIEFRLLARSGDLCWVRTTATPLRSGDTIIGGAGALSAISEIKMMQQQLQDSESRFRGIFEASNDGILLVDAATHKFHAGNDKICRMLGYSREEMLSLGIENVHFEEDLPLLWKELEWHRKDEIGEFKSLRMIRKDGTFLYTDINTAVLTLGGKEYIVGSIRDITERMKAVEDLRQREEMYRNLVESLKDIIYEIDNDGMIRFMSPAFTRLTGYTVEEITGTPFLDLVHPDDRAWLQDYLYGKNETKYPYIEFRGFTKAGELKWLHSSPKAIRKNGEIVARSGVMIDITQQKQAEEALIKIEQQVTRQNERLTAIMQATPDLVFVYDGQGYCRESYSNGSKKPALDPGVIVGSHLTDVFGPNADFHLGKIGEAIQGRTLVSYDYCIEKDGEQYIYEARLTPIGNEVLVFARDITEARKSIREVQILSQAIEQSPLSIVITDLEGNIEYVNQWCTQLTGFAPEEMIGKNPRVLKSGMHTDDFYKNLWKDIREGRQWTGEIQNRKKNGDLYWESAIISPVKNQYGEVTKFIGIKQDITKQKKADQMLKDSVRARDKLFSIIAHDLRGPIGNLVPMIDMITGEYGEDAAMRNELLSDLRKAAINTFDLLENLLQWARYQSKTIEVRPVNFDIGTAISDIIELYMTSANLKGLHLVRNVDAKLMVNADMDSVKLVIRNLLSNALKFTPGNGVITLSAYSQGTEVVVEVADNGVGMPPEVVDRLFHPDFSHSTYGTNYEKGSGLGLLLCKEFVEKNGGKIRVSSTLGEGSRFVFTLHPASEEVKRKPADRIMPVLPKGLLKGKHFLLAEDDPFSQLYAKTLLQQFGSGVDIVPNGQAALDHLRRNKYDLILLDLEMPVLDGFSTIEAIRGELNSDIPVIALSASISNQIISKAYECGFCDYIIKPGKPEELYSRIVRWLGLDTGMPARTPGGSQVSQEAKKYSDTDKLRQAMGNDPELTKMMIRKFLEITPAYHGEILKAYAGGDLDELRKVSHKLKASVNLLANNEISASIKLINDYSGSPENHSKLGSLMDDFREWYPKLYNEIQEELLQMN